MQIRIKTFEQLSTKELYNIYKVRVDVFVVEQECPYPEVDALDLVSTHIYLEEEGEILAYCRVIPPHVRFEEASIGRVLSTRRREGLATKLLKEAISLIEENYPNVAIKIEAQTYARKLYENVGFVQSSDEFLEDGIPHIQMIRRR